MNVNVYLEDELAKSVDKYAKKTGISRNSIIREAVKEWVIHHEIKTWPQSVLNFKGSSKTPAFESFRDNLLSPDDENPLK